MAVAALVISIVSALGTLGASVAWVRRSANADAKLAAIATEQQRIARRPNLRIAGSATDSSCDKLQVAVKLTGPQELAHLDRMSVRIIEDPCTRYLIEKGILTSGEPGQIWAAYRFRLGIDGVEDFGRVARLHLVEGRVAFFSMTRTQAPRGWTATQWREEYAGHPIELEFRCGRGDEEWLVTEVVDVQPIDGRIKHLT
jgi:hypothetical protein